MFYNYCDSTQRIDLVVQLHPYAKATAAQHSAGASDFATAAADATAGVGTAEVDADDGDVEQLQARALHDEQLRSSDDTATHESTVDAATAHTSPPVRHVPDEQQQQQPQQRDTTGKRGGATAGDTDSTRTVLERADSDQLDAAQVRPNLLTTWKSNSNSGAATTATAGAGAAAATANAAANSSTEAAVDTSCDGRAAVFCQLPCADWVGTVFANSSHPLAEGVSRLRTVRTGVADAAADASSSGDFYAGLVQYEYYLGSRPVRHLWYNGWQVKC
jgi:hypothetical protein